MSDYSHCDNCRNLTVVLEKIIASTSKNPKFLKKIAEKGLKHYGWTKPEEGDLHPNTPPNFSPALRKRISDTLYAGDKLARKLEALQTPKDVDLDEIIQNHPKKHAYPFTIRAYEKGYGTAKDVLRTLNSERKYCKHCENSYYEYPIPQLISCEEIHDKIGFTGYYFLRFIEFAEGYPHGAVLDMEESGINMIGNINQGASDIQCELPEVFRKKYIDD